MQLQVTPIDPSRQPNFAAQVSGIDLLTPADASSVEQLWTAINRFSVLVISNQHLLDAQLRDFAARFGPLEVGRMAARGGPRRLAIAQIGDISNLDIDGHVLALNDRKRLDSLGNRLWHTDASYMPVPVVLGMLHAVTLPGASVLGAGETEFADLRAAYDALTPGIQGLIDELIAVHDIFHSRAQIGVTQFPAGEREQYPPSPQRLVRRHPGSGRKTLYLSAHAAHIKDWPVADGCLLLADLSAHATQREFVYSHRWRIGDVVIWDNRCTMHRGRAHDESQPRDLRRATTLEHGSTLDEVA